MVGVERPLFLVLFLLVLPGVYAVFTRHGRARRVAVLRTLLIVLLVGAAAGPTITVQTPVQEEPSLTLLIDESRSTSLFDTYELDLTGVATRERLIASGNSSDLAHGILRHLEPNGNYLVVSDFQSSSGLTQVVDRATTINATLNALQLDASREASVHITGPTTTAAGVSNRYEVHVSTAGDLSVPTPRVRVAGRPVPLQRVGNRTWAFSRSFADEGDYRLTAAITAADRFPQNNQFHQVVRVLEKPQVLMMGGENVLGQELERFYDVSYWNILPDDLEPYHAILLQDKPERDLTTYVSKGNGVVYTGSAEGVSYNILPVTTVPRGQDKGATIVLAIDISISTAEAGAVKRSKQVAYNLVERLPYTNRVGAIAYNDEAYLISKPEPLIQSRDTLLNKIARLDPNGPSLHDRGLEGAAKLLNETGNIILITDGKIGGLGRNLGVEYEAKQVAASLAPRLITVAVGTDADTGFLQELADRAGGMFLDAESSGRLQFMFGAGGAAGTLESLAVILPQHFITEGLSLSSTVGFFDSVEPKRGANLLVSSTTGRPALTTWRYGLGRVAAFTADSEALERILISDPKLVTRTVAWAVGDPQRKQEQWLRISGARRPDPVQIRASYAAKGLKRQGEELYTGSVTPTQLGVHSFNEYRYAYNYNEELQDVGFNNPRTLVRQTGGDVYTPAEAADLVAAVRQQSSETVPGTQSLSPFLLLFGLLVFLAEVGLRKLNGMK